ncbi:hypothetical protein CP965_09745 [Halarcobacter mediterraneus]|uniref:Uncharacterized protein n=1 Tax=Halarcobacter mediterraneus TaxID=2023153 RepID=A0A4Q1AR70_9BACT|nr:hypothetical protein [Halarcobacter mediterraneus]RXK12054.1 hypothetical protein CP965_09745 [Halarcobacter mediterraneus]
MFNSNNPYSLKNLEKSMKASQLNINVVKEVLKNEKIREIQTKNELNKTLKKNKEHKSTLLNYLKQIEKNILKLNQIINFLLEEKRVSKVEPLNLLSIQKEEHKYF